MPLVSLDRVSLAFGHLPLFDQSTLQIEQGERVSVVGRNGSGKSTLLRVVSGEQPPDTGSVWTAPGLRIATLEQDAAAPPARERVDDDICRQVEARQHELDALFDSPTVALFEIVLETAELLQQRRRAFVCELDGRSVVARDQVAQLAEAVGDRIEDRTSRREWNVLFERRDAQTRRRPQRARVRRLLAAHDPEQRGLPRAVTSDDRDTFARLDLQSGLIEQR